jgi:SARP family transcriptional regulator, regulator of embCAB operon
MADGDCGDWEIRISLLGGLHVLRRDGTVVSVDEWRTGKTMDLLRLLALNDGRPVRTGGLVQRLWPDVSAERGRGSLRTASSQIRHAMRTNCVLRQPEGLVLEGAWVDAVQFLNHARRVSVAARDGDHTLVLALAHEAERLYVGDFHAHDDDSDWAIGQREQLVRARVELLSKAAESAHALHFHREAVDLAGAAVQIDRSSETAQRILMVAHAELGEVASALRVFESYRTGLAEELGADPSPETRELHLRLLRGNTV